MGGVLTLISAGKYSFDGIFTISAPFGIRRFVAKFVPFFIIFKKYYPIYWIKLEKETNAKWVGNKKIQLNIGTKVKILLKEMKNILLKIECPALLPQGRLEPDTKLKSTDEIFKKIN